MNHSLQLAAELAAIDQAIAKDEAGIRDSQALPLAGTVDACIGHVKGMIRAYVEAATDKPGIDEAADILDWLKLLVRGDPRWNAIRDNCRELVYYRNCIAAGREDALPRSAEKMAVRTARHILLYMRSRCQQQGLLS